MNEHERGWHSGYDAAIHDAAVDGSTARELLITQGIIDPPVRERLEYLRSQLEAESISYGELAELQSLAEHIEPGDVQLAEAAGIDEQEFANPRRTRPPQTKEKERTGTMSDITSITVEQFKAAAAWTVEGENMATVDLYMDLTRENGVLVVTQGDEQATFNRHGIEVG